MLLRYLSIFYAKSSKETIKAHTFKVLKAFRIIRERFNNYFNPIEKQLIKKLIIYHDLGKINPQFQKRINKEFQIECPEGYIPHEWISPAFISEKAENQIKSILKKINLSEDFYNFFIFIILSHHHRDNLFIDDTVIENIIKWINEKFSLNLEYFYSVRDLIIKFNSSENKEIWKKFFKYRVKWLGALMKCDYSASANIFPETTYKDNYQNSFHNWLNKNNWNLREFQIKIGKNSDKNVILVAPTGAGKTESAINWINGDKAFYLLGIRTAVNAMYERFKKIFKEDVVLLHGESSYFFALNETDEEEFNIKIEKAKKLSYPLTIATADQLVTSVFKYPGFELTYFTASYSKLVLDEIQSFAPGAIAAIVVFLKEIASIGGKFMLMTATLPPFIEDELKDLGNIYIEKPKVMNIKRHKIKLIDDSILSDLSLKLIEKKFNENKKILVICNTVKRSQEIYEMLSDLAPRLLHSRFINKDRKVKENEITNSHGTNIWISTQLVEASLDIDFDVLFTENASVESLFQRFGRCYRKRDYKSKQPNIYIFKSLPANIYDKTIFENTWKVLSYYNEKMITEEDKQDIIEKIFSNIKNTKYYSEYKRQKDLLEIGYRSLSKIQAQRDFRNITNNYIVIPEKVFYDNKNEIKSLINFIEKSNNRLERLKYQAKFMDYTMPVQIFSKNKRFLKKIPNSKFCIKRNIFIISSCDYSYEKGLMLKSPELEDNII